LVTAATEGKSLQAKLERTRFLSRFRSQKRVREDRMRRVLRGAGCSVAVVAAWVCLASCASEQGDHGDAGASGAVGSEFLLDQATKSFSPLPSVMQSSKHPISDAKVTLGRQLFFDVRLSKNQDLACATCHTLPDYGVDRRNGQPSVSLGDRDQAGTRNAPTVYNAALHIAEFWDGRAVDVEEQAKGPILNPIEMAMPDADSVVTVLKSIPGYQPLFASAFAGAGDPVTYDNVGIAIGAFERKLVTKDRFDRYLAGEDDALSDVELRGLGTFMDSGCPTCHEGPGIGGTSYRKIGVLKAYPTTDVGRYAVTKKETDRYAFKVPSLRNIEKTGPYFHDGSQATLPDAVRTMAEYQTSKGMLSDAEVKDVVTFLKALTGDLPTSYIKEPAMLPSSSTTPDPDPS
jgi:cytochrome c peroxidase